MSAFLALLAAVNPAAVAVALWPRPRLVVVAAAAVVAVGVAVVGAAVSEPVLDALDVSAPTFRVAAGVVLGIASARLLVLGAREEAIDGAADSWQRLVVPLLFPVLLTPQLVIVSISAGADDGVAVVALGAAIALALAVAVVVVRSRSIVWPVGARFVAALGVAVALGLAVDGVLTI